MLGPRTEDNGLCVMTCGILRIDTRGMLGRMELVAVFARMRAVPGKDANFSPSLFAHVLVNAATGRQDCFTSVTLIPNC